MAKLHPHFLFVLLVATPACYSPHLVKGPGGDIGGIPFFLKVPQYTRTTEYEARWLEVTLRLRRGEKDPPAELVQRIPVAARDALNELADTIKQGGKDAQESHQEAWSGFTTDLESLPRTDPDHARKAEELRTKVLQSEEQEARNAWENIRQQFEALPAIEDLEEELAKKGSVEVPKRMVGNRIDYTPYVDYSKPYIYNVDVPIFSKVDSTLELNGDLLLTKATTSVDQAGLATGLTSLLPIKEFLSEKLLDSAAAAAATALMGFGPTIEAPAELTVELVVAEKAVRYAFQRRSSCACKLPDLLPFDLATDFTRQSLDAAPRKEPEDPKAKKAGFALSGEVKLPK